MQNTQQTIKWETREVDISLLKPAVYNPRKINKYAKGTFIANVNKYGNLEPIIVNQDYTIIGGHMRYTLAVESGAKTVQVSYPSRLLDLNEEKNLNLILNSVGGYTEMSKLMSLGLSVDELNELGFNELKMPDPKNEDVKPAKKDKNPLVYNLYYFRENFFTVQNVIKRIMKEKNLKSQSEAVLYLIRM